MTTASSSATVPVSTTRACSNSCRSGTTVRPGRRSRSTPTSSLSVRAGDRAAVDVADHHRRRGGPELELRQLGVVLERRRPVSRRLGLSDPQLDCVQRAAVRPRCLLGVGDAVARRHHVELTGPDRLLGAEAVAVHDLAVEQPRDRLQPDVRMGADLHAASAVDEHFRGVVEEAPRTDGAPPPRRQRPPHRRLADHRFTAGRHARADVAGPRARRRSSATSTVRTGPLMSHRSVLPCLRLGARSGRPPE